MTDDSELDRLRIGGEIALAERIEVDRERLRRIITFRMDHRLVGRLDPGDVLQELFLEVRHRLERYVEDPGVPVFVWLRGLLLEILICLHWKHLQTKKLDAGVEVSLDAIGSNASSIPQLARHLADRGMTPGHVVQRVERSSLIESALQQLDEHDRELLTLRHFEQLSNDEVARILGVKKAAASRRSTRALVRLREALGDSISGDV